MRQPRQFRFALVALITYVVALALFPGSVDSRANLLQHTAYAAKFAERCARGAIIEVIRLWTYKL